MGHDEWMTLEHSLIDEPLRIKKPRVTMNLVDVRNRDKWKRRARILLAGLKRERVFCKDVENEWFEEMGRYQKALEDLDEARRWAIHFKGLYEQGAPMTIAGMNTRIAELKERNKRLIKEIDDYIAREEDNDI